MRAKQVDVVTLNFYPARASIGTGKQLNLKISVIIEIVDREAKNRFVLIALPNTKADKHIIRSSGTANCATKSAVMALPC